MVGLFKITKHNYKFSKNSNDQNNSCFRKSYLMSYFLTQVEYVEFDCMINEPAAQLAGADPSRCNATNMQNPTLQQNCYTF